MTGKSDLFMSNVAGRSRFDFRANLIWLLPLLVTFFLSIWFQLRVCENKTVFLCDSAGYLANASDCARVLIDAVDGKFDEAWRLVSSKEFVARMVVDGPVIPLFGAIAFIVSGKSAVATNWVTMVFWLSLFNGICAGGVAILTKIQTRSFMFGLFAGVLFGFYPGTLITAGRFLTEPLSAALLIVQVLLGCYLIKSVGRWPSLMNATLIGVLAGIGVLLKTALLPAWGLLSLAPVLLKADCSRSKIAASCLAMIAGGCLMIGGWAAYTKIASGTLYLIPQRVPLLNIAVGHDLDTDGWMSGIGTFRTGHLSTSKTSAELLVTSWRLSPVKMADLYLRKVSRTMGFVWNDFKQSVLFLDVNQQNWLHAVLIAFATTGMLFSMSSLLRALRSQPFDAVWVYSSLSCLIIVFTHALIYLPFEANSRYGYPCVPFLFCLAAVGAREIWMSKLRNVLFLLVSLSVLTTKIDLIQIFSVWFSFAPSLVLTEVVRFVILASTAGMLLWSVRTVSHSTVNSNRSNTFVLSLEALLFVLFVLLPVALTTAFTADRRTVAINLSPGQSLTRTITLPAQLANTELAQYFLLVDCNDKFAQAQYKVNDVALEGRPISANKLDSSASGAFDVLRMISQAMDLSADQLRQWRVIPIPSDVLRFGQSNILQVNSSGPGFSLLADRLFHGETSVRLPSRRSMSLSKAYNLDPVDAIESRIVDRNATSVENSSAAIVKSEGLPASRLIDIKPRLFVLKVESKAPFKFLANPVEKTISISPEQFDPVMYQGNSPGWIRNNRYTLAQAVSTGVAVDFPKGIEAKGILEVAVSGEILSAGRENKAGILLAINSSQPSSGPIFLSSTPPYISAAKHWTSFEIIDQVNFNYDKRRFDQLSLLLFPGRAEQIMQYGVDRTVGSFYLKNLQVRFRQIALPDLADCKETLF